MKTTRRLGSIAVFVIALISTAPEVGAQTSTTGAIRGVVTDASTGRTLAGVTVVVTSPALQGSQAEITDDAGRYYLTNLPPGTYLVSFYYADAKVQVKDVQVRLGATKVVNRSLDPAQGEIIVIEDRGTIIDPTSTNQGTVITQDQMQNIPVPGRTFESTLGQAPGSAGDSAGVGFSGSTSLENQYVVDGVNTTGLTFGTVGTPLINEFIEEIQVLTGGYQAEYGRATGGVVNVVTKSGSNEFHGSVFGTVLPYQVDRTPVRPVATAIEGVYDLDYQLDFGFDLGGPIVKDKVWFYVGIAPRIARTNVTRIVKRNVDCHGTNPDGSLTVCDPEMYQDGSRDEDPETGDLLFEEVDRTGWKTSASQYQFVSKINYAASPEHQGQVSLLGVPAAGEGLFGVTGAPEATRADYQSLNTDFAAKWTSKFNDNKTEVELVAGWHREKYDQDSLASPANNTPTTRVYFSDLSHFGQAGGESQAVLEGCNDAGSRGNDDYPFITNCEVFQYWLDSPGFTIDNLEDRRSLELNVTQRVEAAGSHVLKAGVDVQDNRTRDVRHFTGGRYYQLIHGGFNQVRVYRYVTPHPEAGDVCGFEEGDYDMPRTCDYLDRSVVNGQTLNWSAFAQDSWQVQPNITLNYGMRYEEQRLRYAEHLRGTEDPFTGDKLHNNAIRLRGMWAPRIGALYDWTKEGRSKVYAHFGRFYESIPMSLNEAAFSGDTLYAAFFNFDQCAQGDAPSQDSLGNSPSPYNCPEEITEATNPAAGELYRGGTTVVTPGTKAQYLDEAILGVEYEVLEDFTLGAAFKTRRIGRVLEDISIDNAETYIIGNPGQFDADEEAKLERRLAMLEPGTDEYEELAAELEGFRHLRSFDEPRRDYNAVELVATKRFSRSFYIQSSYTYSRTKGNYPGLLNDDTGSGLANASTQYDLAELLANRDGPLPQDRPHYFKLDGYYTWDFEEAGITTLGMRFRALSGTPLDALGAHYLYGFGESYLLPRGSQGRTQFVTNTDIHASYGRKLAKGYELHAFVDVINLLNQEQIFREDELYTFDNVDPIVGGTREDLVFAKQVGDFGGETSDPITRNVGYDTPLSRYAPLYVRFGARLTF